MLNTDAHNPAIKASRKMTKEQVSLRMYLCNIHERQVFKPFMK
jgi:Sec7-like guanine-nucleotide exchange factor